MNGERRKERRKDEWKEGSNGGKERVEEGKGEVTCSLPPRSILPKGGRKGEEE